MHAYGRADDEISKGLFLRESSRGLYWESKMNKLKKSIKPATKFETYYRPGANYFVPTKVL